MKNLKYLFVSLNIVNGEYEHFQHSVHAISKKTNSEEYANKQAKESFGGTPKFEDDVYYFFGEVAVSINDFREITKEEFEVLARFL